MNNSLPAPPLIIASNQTIEADVVIVGTLQVVPSVSLQVNGSLTLEPTSQVVLGDTVVVVSGAVVLGGDLTLVLSSVPATGSVYQLFQAQSVSGQFQNVYANITDLRSCESATAEPTSQSAASTFAVVVTVNSDACGLDTTVLVGIIVGCVLLIVLALAVPLGIRSYLRRQAVEKKLQRLHQPM